MSDKEFKKIVLRYLLNIVVIILMVVVLILAANKLLPEFFQYVGVGIIIINCFLFTAFMKKYKK